MIDADGAEDELPTIRHLVTPERIQLIGLVMVGYKLKRLKNSRAKLNYGRFVGFFGLSPSYYSG